MLSYVLPIILVVFSNVVYQICAKSIPGEINPLASLTITLFCRRSVFGCDVFCTEPQWKFVSGVF